MPRRLHERRARGHRGMGRRPSDEPLRRHLPSWQQRPLHLRP
ncbi:hypothetical protein VHUM_00530 [Vanrija humicola]|uniref:Uncharacterized protein n=1 Tax=Vanrija humicola TaxID=5417 RepID=A0A7D9A2F4_VANHU|nr:hypothetical protein VHUM_00530 [Vanrija humicola]